MCQFVHVSILVSEILLPVSTFLPSDFFLQSKGGNRKTAETMFLSELTPMLTLGATF